MGTAREIRQARRYRLMARPPFDVCFPSIDYRVDVVKVIGGPQWRLEARTAGEAAAWTLCHAGERVEWLERELYETGFAVMAPTVPSLILDRLVAEGKAERVGGNGVEKGRRLPP